MNNRFGNQTAEVIKKQWKKLAISIVILFEVFAIVIVSSYAWVEMFSSVKIMNASETFGTVNTYVFTEATIGSQEGTIDLGQYFRQAGDMHFAPASSADGLTMYFPKVGSNSYRKGNASDKNTNYLSATFKLKADTNIDVFFDQVPDFGITADGYMRVSVTYQSEGSTFAPETKIYAIDEGSSNVVNATDGSKINTAVEAFSDHIKSEGTASRLFAMGANETKIVTINIWMQDKPNINPNTASNVLSQNITINNFGITAALAPRHVTLMPTSLWKTSGSNNEYFYAWCWNDGAAGSLYPLALDANEHYSFEYSSKYNHMLFIRSGRDDLTTASMNNGAALNDSSFVLNKTESTSLPNYPVNPTYVIDTLDGGESSSSTGSWHELAKVKVAYVNDNESENYGTIAATSYIGDDTDSAIIETTDENSQKHQDTVHALPEKKLRLTASPEDDHYVFIGWYDNENGDGEVISGSRSNNFITDAPDTASSITYYAKFSIKEEYTFTLHKIVDGEESQTDAGEITFNGNIMANNVVSVSGTFNRGESVAFSAEANLGYTFDGFYTALNGGNQMESPLTIDADCIASIVNDGRIDCYARFETNSYNLEAVATYKNYGGTSYISGDTGGTVKVGADMEGAHSSVSVKYMDQETLTATPAIGYKFVGWYSQAGALLSTDTSFSYTFRWPRPVKIDARFEKRPTTIYITPREGWSDSDYYVRAYTSDESDLTSGTNGFTQATYDKATGYYKVTFNTSRSGNFYTILAKDDHYTDQVPAANEPGYSGTIGSDYVFKRDATGLTEYESQRCIWFIDGTIDDTPSYWITSDCDVNANNRTVIKTYYREDNENSEEVTMLPQGEHAWICEFDSLPSDSQIYFNQVYENNQTSVKNRWQGTIQNLKNQYTATGGAGSDSDGDGDWDQD